MSPKAKAYPSSQKFCGIKYDDERWGKDRRLLANPRWRLNNLYWIIDKWGNKILFRENNVQEDFYNNMWYWNLILKSRQHGFCLDPEMHILTTDLKWICIGDIKPGQKVIGVDEYFPGGRGKAREMRTSIVYDTREVICEAFKIILDDGGSLICSGKHSWLSKKVSVQPEWRTIRADTKKKLRVGTEIRWITKPWEQVLSHADGWMGGIIDGEGSFDCKRTGAHLGVTQSSGVVLDEMRRYLNINGYHFKEYIDNRKAGEKSKWGGKSVYTLDVARMDELFQLLGKTRPSRFINTDWWEGKELPGKRSGTGWSKIVAIEELNKRPLIDLQTSTGTYIANGFVSHNSTLIDLIGLDYALFNDNATVNIIAHKLDDAEELFRKKVEYPYLNLPAELREARKTTKANTREFEFNNNSKIAVDTSVRSDFVNLLHVTEMGKICIDNPKKAEEIVVGSFPAVHTGNFLFIESTSEGSGGYFADWCKKSHNRKLEGKKPNKREMKLHFYPWYQAKHNRLDVEGVQIYPWLNDYFAELKNKYEVILDNEQKAWYANEATTLGDSMRRQHPSFFEEAFWESTEGGYYLRQFRKIREENRITKVPYDPNFLVDTAWDLGVSKVNGTAIWFVQLCGRELHFIDYLENNEDGIDYYAAELQNRQKKYGYRYGKHVAPHDIRVREWGNNAQTRWQSACNLGIKFDIAPEFRVKDGIQATCNLLDLSLFDTEKCKEGYEKLDRYHRKYDVKFNVWHDDPVKDDSVHAADALRMYAVVWRSHIKTGDLKIEPKNIPRGAWC